jgi:nicotinamide-nucleotide amidase
MFARRGIPMPAVNVGQARVPAGARVLRNPLGTAPGLVIEEEGWTVCLLPGVPAEMEHIFEHGFAPYLEEKGYVGERIFEWELNVTGFPESAVAERVGGIPLPGGVRLAYLPQVAQVNLRLWGAAPAERVFRERARSAADALRAALGAHVFGEGGVSLEEVVGRELERRRETIALAESCTGGMVGERVTNVAGSSSWFRGGVVAYANDVKVGFLAVSEATLAAHGAVSEETAREMAAGARERFDATYGLAVTGVAGPGGGTAEKPVGTVCFGLAGPGGASSRRAVFNGDRDWVRRRATQGALDFLRRRLGGATP